MGDNLLSMKANKWQKSAEGRYEIRGKCMACVGYGAIGSTVGILAESLGMRVIFYDIIPKLSYGNAKQISDLDSLLSQADFISLHVPLTDKTRNMIDAKRISQMKTGSYLLNSSRGNVVVISDVVSALKSGHLAGFYADVFPYEPKSNNCQWLTDVDISKDELKLTNTIISDTDHDQQQLYELMQLPNVILSSHIGGSTQESQKAIARDVSNKIINFLTTGSTIGAVNLPQLSLPTSHSSLNFSVKPRYRICNFHQNIPGTLRNIIRCLEEFNIVQQNLVTSGDIGYCIIDVEIHKVTNKDLRDLKDDDKCKGELKDKVECKDKLIHQEGELNEKLNIISDEDLKDIDDKGETEFELAYNKIKELPTTIRCFSLIY